MTEQKVQEINYINFEYYKLIHDALGIAFKIDGEPIPPFESGDMDAVDYLVNAPILGLTHAPHTAKIPTL